jgi:serine/threonine protein kinase/cytochrome c-type biogenesis protein CcmH/NrfG
MDSQRWQDIKRHLNAILDLPADQRPAYLDKVGGNDSSLRLEVQSLLIAHEQAGDSFLQSARTQESVRLRRDTQIEPYEIASLLGAGGMGEVYRARDTRLQRMVAIKILPRYLSDKTEAKERLEREAQAIAALNHPNICQLYDIGSQEGTEYLVMELLEGETLATKLQRGPLPLKGVLSIGIDVAEALESAHSKGIIHRDIKPGNVFLTERGTAKVLDLGLAKLTAQRAASAGRGEDDVTSPTVATENLTDSGATVGTVAYMSPEQVRGEKLDIRSDLFSFGATLYEMSTGAGPFVGRTSALVFDAILNRSPVDPAQQNPTIPAEMRRILNTSLEKDRGLRYQSAAVLGADLKRLMRDSKSARSPDASRAYPVASAPTPFRSSIAVLPLQNLSGDPANEYFSDGMSEEISTKLSRIQELTVAPYSVTSRFKDAQKTPQDVAREIQVRYLLEGSIRKAQNQVRINVSLTDTSTGFQVWADDFRSEMQDVFTLQEQTALQIAEALNLDLSPQEQRWVQRRYTQNVEAYDEFLRGRALALYYANRDPMVAARKHFQRALDLDPNYAPALAGLARVEAICYRQFEPDESHLHRAEQLVQHALVIDPHLVEAQFALGQIAGHRYDYARGAEILREVTRSRPQDAEAWDLLAWSLGYRQPPDPIESELAAREAIRLQPSLSGAYYHLGRALILQRRHHEARGAFEHGRELHPSGTGDPGLAQLYLAEGDSHRAVALLEKFARRRGGIISLFWLASAFAADGNKDQALTTKRKLSRAGSLIPQPSRQAPSVVHGCRTQSAPAADPFGQIAQSG